MTTLKSGRSQTDLILVRSMNAVKRRYSADGSATLGDLVGQMDASLSAIAIALLALPFLWPFSLGPLTMPVSGLMVFWAWRMLPRRESEEKVKSDGAELPKSRFARWRAGAQERFLRTPLPRPAYRIMCRLLIAVLRWKHWFTRPRLFAFTDGTRGRLIAGWGILLGAVLLAVPVPLLPLTNTFPALGIIMVAFGWTDRDGLLTILGFVSYAIATIIFAALAFAVLYFGYEAIGMINGWIADFTGLDFLRHSEEAPAE